MSTYYLTSQLPSLDAIGDSTPLPITEERFFELLERFLGKKALDEARRLTLVPSREGEESSSALISAWNDAERKLRLALFKARAEKLKKPFDAGDVILPIELTRVAFAATEMRDPLEAEKYLNAYRLEFLESLRPMDSFSEDFLFYYGLKLKLITRLRQFDTELGGSAYRNIYNSVLNGDGLEVKQ